MSPTKSDRTVKAWMVKLLISIIGLVCGALAIYFTAYADIVKNSAVQDIKIATVCEKVDDNKDEINKLKRNDSLFLELVREINFNLRALNHKIDIMSGDSI